LLVVCGLGRLSFQSPYLYLLPPRALSSFPSNNPDEQDSVGYDNSLQINLSDESFVRLAFCGLCEGNGLAR
jgi:hypothetical protein